jgi:hypothetical protein
MEDNCRNNCRTPRYLRGNPGPGRNVYDLRLMDYDQISSIIF